MIILNSFPLFSRFEYLATRRERRLRSAWRLTLTHVIEPAGDFPVHLVTCSHSDSQHDFGDEARQPRHLLDPHHKLLQRHNHSISLVKLPRKSLNHNIELRACTRMLSPLPDMKQPLNSTFVQSSYSLNGTNYADHPVLIISKPLQCLYVQKTHWSTSPLSCCSHTVHTEWKKALLGTVPLRSPPEKPAMF